MLSGERVRGDRLWVLGALALGTVAFGCGSGNQSGGTGGTGGTGGSSSATLTTTFATKLNTEVDILFVIDNWASTTETQTKVYDQIPLFMSVLQSLPTPLDLHVAVITTDMGAPGDATSAIACSTLGDGGVFSSAPRGTCTSTGLESGATYLADAKGVANFTGQLASALQCIMLVGGTGCGFGQPLAALDRALGADGQLPSANVNFLRPEAYLAIILVANEDDCSAPANTQLFSLNGGDQNLRNPLGPISHYRCNQFGHLCTDPSGQTIMPPLVPPSDAQETGGAPTLDLTSCTSNDSGLGLLTPVSQFVSDIRSLKVDPDNQIIVSAIVAPTTPYTVRWVPEQGGQNTQPGELWPEIEHSCGAAGGDDVNPEATSNPTDGSFGDPAVRISQFVKAFPNSVLASICDPSYASAMQVIATKVGALPSPPCLTGKIQQTIKALPDCSVTADLMDSSGDFTEVSYENCATTGNTPPCWSLVAGGACTEGAALEVTDAPGAPSTSVTVSCSLCEPGASASGC
jgi:hypothetical protein